MALSNRLAILVGGLGGLGSITGRVLRAQGARLAILYAPAESANVKPVLRNVLDCDVDPNDVRTYECDITSVESVESAFGNIEKDQTDFPSILVNTAGHVTLCPLENFPTHDVLTHYMVNLYGPTLTGQAFARLYFRAAAAAARSSSNSAHPGGRIINIASQAAHVSLLNHGPYCASKAGLIGLTRSMATEWGPRGITANSISPGPVMTRLGQKAWADEKVRSEYLAAVPTGRFAEPIEVANIVEFLCRDESLNINGTDIRLDGGYTAS